MVPHRLHKDETFLASYGFSVEAKSFMVRRGVPEMLPAGIKVDVSDYPHFNA